MPGNKHFLWVIKYQSEVGALRTTKLFIAYVFHCQEHYFCFITEEETINHNTNKRLYSLPHEILFLILHRVPIKAGFCRINISKRAVNVQNLSFQYQHCCFAEGGGLCFWKGKLSGRFQIFPEKFRLNEIKMLQISQPVSAQLLCRDIKVQRALPSVSWEWQKSFPRCFIQDTQRFSHHIPSSNSDVAAVRVKSCSQPKRQVRLLYGTRHTAFGTSCSQATQDMENITHRIKRAAFLVRSSAATYSWAGVRGSSSCSHPSPSPSPALNCPLCCTGIMALGLRVKSEPAHPLHNRGALS